MNTMEGVRKGHGSSDIKQLSGAGVRQRLGLQEKLWAEEQESCGLLIQQLLLGDAAHCLNQ